MDRDSASRLWKLMASKIQSHICGKIFRSLSWCPHRHVSSVCPEIWAKLWKIAISRNI